MKSPFYIFRNLSGLLLLAAVSAVSLRAASFTQTLTLDAGWNSVWLNVEPRYDSGTNAGVAKSVEDVFANAAITIVATPENPVGTAEFITDAETLRFNQAGWRVWRRASEVKTDTLATVQGQQGYLVFVSGTTGISLDVTGDAAFKIPRWQADSYNLKGFGLTSSVTFNNFFATAGGRHPINRIFRLQTDGNWVAVRGTDTMQEGRAYWIYSDGPSTFYGPVKVSFQGATGLDFADGPASVELPDPQGNPGDTLLVNVRELTLVEGSGTAQTVTIRKVTPATTGGAALGDDLRIYEVAPDTNELDYGIGPNGLIVEGIFNLSSNATKTISLGAHRAWSSGAHERENLYRIELGYNYLWLPMSAANGDVPAGETNVANVSYAGLWVGEVILDEVSSVTESGRPLQPATSKAPMRLLVHVDGSGNASLLSHVMVMRTKTATNSVRPDPVLVIDEGKIPYFEGIEERGGKKVGQRLESTSYDMPRKMDTTNQAALVSATATALGISTNAVTEANIRTYVNGQSSRPVPLVEKYHLTWPLEGGLGTNAVVQTSTNQPLTLDPFHRSNPFRHAYHPKHGTGYAITRNVKLRFNCGYEAGVLKGTYEETISGLAAFSLQTRGSVVLRRISDVSTLQ